MADIKGDREIYGVEVQRSVITYGNIVALST